MIKPFYLSAIEGLPVKKREGFNTRRGSPRNHVYKVTIGDYVYFKVHIKRDNKSYIRYFKLKKDAKKFASLLDKYKNFQLAENAMGVLF